MIFGGPYGMYAAAEGSDNNVFMGLQYSQRTGSVVEGSLFIAVQTTLMECCCI